MLKRSRDNSDEKYFCPDPSRTNFNERIWPEIVRISNWNFAHRMPVNQLLPHGEFLGSETKLAAIPEVVTLAFQKK